MNSGKKVNCEGVLTTRSNGELADLLKGSRILYIEMRFLKNGQKVLNGQAASDSDLGSGISRPDSCPLLA